MLTAGTACAYTYAGGAGSRVNLRTGTGNCSNIAIN
jgi:hypothetical protein